MSTPQHQEWIERLLENDLDEPARVELLAALKADPGLLREFSLHLKISDALARQLEERQDENFIRSTANHVMALAQEDENAFVGGLTRRIVRRNWSRRLAIAAVISLAGFGSFLVYRQATALPTIGNLIELDANGKVLARREAKGGTHHVPKDGFFRIRFNNGAVVAIEGPAHFKIDSPKRMHLHTGKLNAWCPETAHGFQVVTATGTVTDLGTSFGVSTDATGASDFLVLDGLIEVSRGKETRRVTEGQAVRTAESTGIKDLDFEPTPFSRTWPLASGILSTKGSVVPASPGTPEQLSKLESDDTVMVIPEKRNVIFDQSIEAELIAPGSFSAKNAKQLHHIAADPEMRLRGFLIRYNPKWSTDFRRFDGEVTFDRPVMAICCQGKYLDATDEAFANGVYTDVSEKARAFRGIDLDQPSKFPEMVTLSEDRRTVKILFNAGVSSDDIRVILEEN